VAMRDDILNAVYEAARLHKKYDTEARASRGEGRIDVFGMLVDRDIPVMFRPLRNLLGVYLDDPGQGVMVTTQRPLPVQRFTAAHELGHAVLGHETSLDEEEVLTRALFSTTTAYDPREVQANAFATELLTPAWLIALHMNRQGWKRSGLSDPQVAYQLALRMGSSYAATCYALNDAASLGKAACDRLLKVKPKEIKQSLVKAYEPENWRGDVWLVTERDSGMVLEGSRADLVVIQMKEHASSGYLWQFGDLADAGMKIRVDGRAAAGEEHIGGVVFRTVVAEAKTRDEGAIGHLNLKEVRPWQPAGQPLNSMELDVDLSGPVPAGLLPKQREALLEVA
jgi:Zn-dependent peptidase ImmA (M78 family)